MLKHKRKDISKLSTSKVLAIESIKKINFGDIDGLYDPNIKDYFIDNQYKRALLKESKYFVIGRKGTGKSALYNWLSRIQSEEEIMVVNKQFSDFPFEKLLRLSDDSFSKPNQYQSIWKNIIYSEIARMIITDQTSNALDESWEELKEYINHVFGSNLLELHKEIVRKVRKYDFSLGYDSTCIGSSSSSEQELYDGYTNLTKINERLQDIITNYLLVNSSRQYIIQFDQLDDNYTAYINRQDYLQCLISLFKSIYQINQTNRSKGIKVKVIAYLRSDIFNQFNRYDPDSSRWEQYVLKLNWAIINKNDWNNSNLLKLINARIKNSLKTLTPTEPFYSLFGGQIVGKAKDYIFKYLVHRTFQRPRDLIQFCIKLQEEIVDTSNFTMTTVKNAEKQYSLWLLGEIENEIAPQVNDTESLYEMLRLFGREAYTVSGFKAKYKNYANRFPEITAEEMLKLLYNFGIIYNVILGDGQNIIEQFSVIRNDRSVFNRDLNIKTHPGFYEGLHTSKFMNR